MKTCLTWIKSSKDQWLEEATAIYEKKISHFVPFKVNSLKAISAGRKQQDFKLAKEESLLSKQFESSDYLVIFDELGTAPNDSVEFSKHLVQGIESGKRRLHFVVGGAFGLGEATRAKADKILSLSRLTFSHQIALIVALEQIYRGFTIYKGLPYHNERK